MAASADVANEETDLSCDYSPGEDFEEVRMRFPFEVPLSDSTEVWLIQEPMNQLLPSDINGKEISLKLHKEELGKLDLSSGKSFEVVTFTSEEPSALLFLPGAHSHEAAVKISRRVCLVHYPEAGEMEKSKPYLTSSIQRSGGSQRSSIPSGSSTPSKARFGGSSRDTLTSTHTEGQSAESTKHSSKKRARDSSSVETGRSSRRHSQMSQPESHVTGDSFGSPGESPGRSSRKKNKIKQ